MNSSITHEIEIKDIGGLQKLDLAVSRTTVTALPSVSTYESWIRDKEVIGVLMRHHGRIIAQRWFQPFDFLEIQDKQLKKAYWLHNTKVHPKYQNRGIYQSMANYCSHFLGIDNYNLVSQIEENNKRMQYIATKSGFKRIAFLRLSVVIFRRRLFVRKEKLLFKNETEEMRRTIMQIGNWSLQSLPGETQAKWFSKRIEEEKGEIRIRISSPIHSIQGRGIGPITIRKSLMFVHFNIEGDEEKGWSARRVITKSMFELSNSLARTCLFVIERRQFEKYFRNWSLAYVAIPVSYSIFLREPNRNS